MEELRTVWDQIEIFTFWMHTLVSWQILLQFETWYFRRHMIFQGTIVHNTKVTGNELKMQQWKPLDWLTVLHSVLTGESHYYPSSLVTHPAGCVVECQSGLETLMWHPGGRQTDTGAIAGTNSRLLVWSIAGVPVWLHSHTRTPNTLSSFFLSSKQQNTFFF